MLISGGRFAVAPGGVPGQIAMDKWPGGGVQPELAACVIDGAEVGACAQVPAATAAATIETNSIRII
jgi:hypothetical protein